MSEQRDYSISVLQSALSVLETFLEAERSEQSLTEITQHLGLNKSRVFRILATLEQHGFVAQDAETREYRLGLKLLELGNAVQRRLSIVPAARSSLDKLAQTTGETVFLGIMDGYECLCIDKRESQYSIRLYGEVGRRTPLHVGGVPKVLLAYCVEEQPEVLMALPLTKFTPATLTDQEALLELLAGIRRDGYLVTPDDLDWGATSVAAPVRDHTGRVVAALSIAGPSDRFTAERVERFIGLVGDAADHVSRQLGYRPAEPMLVRRPNTNGHAPALNGHTISNLQSLSATKET